MNFKADIRKSTDYSPFGVMLENRNFAPHTSIALELDPNEVYFRFTLRDDSGGSTEYTASSGSQGSAFETELDALLAYFNSVEGIHAFRDGYKVTFVVNECKFTLDETTPYDYDLDYSVDPIFVKRPCGDYRYGYQGSEMDNEVKGEGNSYTTEFRQLDPRLGRWLSLDAVLHPNQSPYCSMDNRPTIIRDQMGTNGEITVKEEGGKETMTMSNTVVLYNTDPDHISQSRMLEVKRAIENQVATIGTSADQHFSVGSHSNLRIEGKVTVIFASNEAEALQMAKDLCDGNVFGVVATGSSYVETDGENSHMKGQLSLESMDGQGSYNYNFAHEWLHLFGLEDRYVAGSKLSQDGRTIVERGSVPIAVPGDGEYYGPKKPNIMVKSVGNSTKATNLFRSQVEYLLSYSNAYGYTGFSPTRATQEFINEYKDGMILSPTQRFDHIWQPNPGIGYYDGTSRSRKSGINRYNGLNSGAQGEIDKYLGR